jgi:hypothetical protein
MKATRILIVIAILQALMLVTLWKGDGIATSAQANVPEPGADRKEMISELKALNEKFAGVQKLMESGNLQVQIVGSDEKKAK